MLGIVIHFVIGFDLILRPQGHGERITDGFSQSTEEDACRISVKAQLLDSVARAAPSLLLTGDLGAPDFCPGPYLVILHSGVTVRGRHLSRMIAVIAIEMCCEIADFAILKQHSRRDVGIN